MPIRGATLAEAAKKFRDHLNYVLSRTVTQTPAVLVEVPGAPSFQITFRQAGQPIQAQLNTRFGQMGFYLGQVCGSIVREDGLHELRTLSYKYALYPDRSDEPIIRWEYVREPGPQDQWCRHHLQGPIEIRLNQHTVSLNDFHLPTGYVTFEEVLRFCIVDLMVPPLQDEWDRRLRESYERFKVDFAH